MNSLNILSVNDVSCSFGAVDTNSNGTQISRLSILTNLGKILGPFVDLVISKGYILGPKLIGLCQVQLLLRILFRQINTERMPTFFSPKH